MPTFIVGTVLEHNREAEVGVLQDRLKAKGVPAESVVPFLEKTLVKHGLVELQDNVVSATETGVNYIAQHTGYIEEIYQPDSTKRPKLGPAKYQLLDLMQAEAGPDGWLLDKNNTTTHVFDYLKDKLGWSRDNASRRVYDLDKSGFINKKYWTNTNGRGNIVVNSQLTPQGEAELEAMRVCFREEIVQLEEGYSKKPPQPRALSPQEIQPTFASITDEINNMLWELGEELRDFTELEQGTEDEMRAAIDQLRLVMQDLEKRLDQANPKLLR